MRQTSIAIARSVDERGLATLAGQFADLFLPRARIGHDRFTIARYTLGMRVFILFVPVIGFALSGCVSTLAAVVTAPVKVVSKVADWTTTSQDEADRNRGRELRAREEQVGKLARQRDKAAHKCAEGDAEQCARVQVLEHEIEAQMARSI